MEVGGITAHLRALQAGRGRRPGKGEEETEVVGAWGMMVGMMVEVAVGKRRRRGGNSRIRGKKITGRNAQHVFVVVGERGYEVGVGLC